MSDENEVEYGIAENNPTPPLLQFRNFQHDIIGTLEFVDKSMKFNGDVEACARQFFHHVIKVHDAVVASLEKQLEIAQGFHTVAVQERDLARMQLDRKETPGFAMDTTKAIDKVHTLIYMAMLAEDAKPESERKPVTVRVMIGGVPI